jgi:hypothetical protein
MIERNLQAVAEAWLEPIASIATAARTVAVRHESMTPEVRHEVLGLLYERTTEVRDAAIKLHSICTGDVDLWARRAWVRPSTTAENVDS